MGWLISSIQYSKRIVEVTRNEQKEDETMIINERRKEYDYVKKYIE